MFLYFHIYFCLCCVFVVVVVVIIGCSRAHLKNINMFLENMNSARVSEKRCEVKDT